MISIDERYKIDLDALVAAIEEDRAAGHLPICVVANAGTVATGAVDPLARISEIAQRFNLWLHIDAAYGGFAALAPTARPLFTSIAQADSVALDPHKWLYLPVDCGCTTPSVSATATAASAALPPFLRTPSPTCVANGDDVESAAFFAVTCDPAKSGVVKKKSAAAIARFISRVLAAARDSDRE